jgi:P-type E1-E2 ATPase
MLLEFMLKSSTALCCRLSPKQKSQITKVLKDKAGKIILCVGDGTNDVPMILESNVGIGISGIEGTQVNY